MNARKFSTLVPSFFPNFLKEWETLRPVEFPIVSHEDVEEVVKHSIFSLSVIFDCAFFNTTLWTTDCLKKFTRSYVKNVRYERKLWRNSRNKFTITLDFHVNVCILFYG